MSRKSQNTLTVNIDVKPNSYPNHFNINCHKVIPIATFGSIDFDVADLKIDDTLSFNGLKIKNRIIWIINTTFFNWINSIPKPLKRTAI